MSLSKGRRNARLTLVYMAFAVVVVVVGSAWIVQTADEEVAAPVPEGIAMLTEAAELAPTTFARRIAGRWTTRNGEACSDGAEVAFEDGRLLITQAQSRTRHLVFYDVRFETRTQTESASTTEDYVFTPEFLATSAERNFNLVITNVSRNETATWFPCELTR